MCVCMCMNVWRCVCVRAVEGCLVCRCVCVWGGVGGGGGVVVVTCDHGFSGHQQTRH